MTRIFATGLGRPETPVRLEDGTWLVVEMSPQRGCVTQLSSEGRIARVVARTGRPNGVRMGADGALWVAESGPSPALLRVTMEGEISTWLTEVEGRPFLFPNDLCFGPDGMLYMTDSGIPQPRWASVPPGERHGLDFDGRLYQIDLDGGGATILDDGLRFANGVALGPGGDALFVSETLTGSIYAYPMGEGRVRAPRHLFANVLDPTVDVPLKGPDGMAFGADGRLYVAVFGEGDVAVVRPDGAVVERLRTAGKEPTNVAFGARGERRLYVTETELGQVEVFEVESDGAPLRRR